MINISVEIYKVISWGGQSIMLSLVIILISAITGILLGRLLADIER